MSFPVVLTIGSNVFATISSSDGDRICSYFRPLPASPGRTTSEAATGAGNVGSTDFSVPSFFGRSIWSMVIGFWTSTGFGFGFLRHRSWAASVMVACGPPSFSWNGWLVSSRFDWLNKSDILTEQDDKTFFALTDSCPLNWYLDFDEWFEKLDG